MPVAVQHDRLRDPRDIAAVLKGRRHRAGRLAVVYVRETDRGDAARVAVVASRKVGAAVARNRAKRLLREAIRHIALPPGTELVLVARSSCASSRMPAVLAELTELTTELGLVPEIAEAS